MENKEKTLTLVRFYFGENAERLQGGISARLAAWSRAYEAWVEQRKEINKNAAVMCRIAWERLAGQWGKMPWEITQEDIREHMRWMEAQGYKKGTINGEVGLISEFYEWSAAHKVDEMCGALNPTRGVRRLRRERFEGARTWSREEVELLLELVGRDETVLGKREKAFFLLRLNSGVLLKQISNLRWEQIEQQGEDAWVRWSEKYAPTRLPREVWEAIKDYLKASGRLDGMERGKVIFAPLRYPYMEERGSEAKDWTEEHAITNTRIIENLRVYGRRAWIDKDKLNMHALRRTAIRLRLEAGDSVEEMRQFMDSQEEQRFTKHRLGKVPAMAEDDGKVIERVPAPPRHAKRFREGERVKHGMFRQHQDSLAVRRMMEGELWTVEEEISCLRVLMKGLVELGAHEESTIEAYTLSAYRLAELISFRKATKETEELKWADWLKKFDEWHEKYNGFASSEQVRAAANQSQVDGNIREEVATLKLILRNLYQSAEACKEKQEYVRLVNLYGKGCTRLMRMMMLEKDELGRLGRYIEAMIDQAIRGVREEWKTKRLNV